MKNLGISVLAATALFVCTLGNVTRADTDRTNKLTKQTCDCTTIAVTITEKNTKTNTTGSDTTTPV